jgi:4-hydroxyphenylpyruvate dioxygenase-like putative hemolysin
VSSPDELARRREADRIRKAKKRAEDRAARGAAADEVARAHGPSAPTSLASIHDVRQALEWALAQVAADTHNSPTNRARVAGMLAREASNLVQVHDLAQRVDELEKQLVDRPGAA